MSLGQKRTLFTLAFAELIRFAFECGYEVRIADVMRNSRVFGKWGEKKGYGSKCSVHKLGLAGDLDLFVDGEYIQTSEHEAWKVLHDKWEELGGAPMIENDANHFSFWWGQYR